MMKLKHNPGLKLFEMKGPEQSQPVRPSDDGMQHFAVYIDDINEAVSLFERAGGRIFTFPQPLMFNNQ